MNNLIRPLRAALEKVPLYAHTRAERSQREVDGYLQQALENRHPRWAMSFSYARAVVIGSIYRPAVHVAALAIFAIVFGSDIFVPFESTDMFTRLSLITVAMLVGVSLSFLLLYLLLPLHPHYRLSLWAIAGIHTLISAILFCLIEPEIILHFQAYTPPRFGAIFVPILLLYGLADLFVIWQFKDEICVMDYGRKHAAAPIETLLPEKKRGEVLLMSAADHYVEFTTEHGSHLRRMTMKAAVAKALRGEGMQVHRSHWVAYRAMFSIEKDGERYFLTLRTGQRVPVSTQNAAKVKCFLDADCQQAAE